MSQYTSQFGQSLQLGQPAPWFKCRTQGNAAFNFDSSAGRYILLGFFQTAAHGAGSKLTDCIHRVHHLFDDENVCYFGVTADPQDEIQKRTVDAIPGIRYFFDFDKSVRKRYGLTEDDQQAVLFLLDPMLRIAGLFRIHAENADFSPMLNILQQLPRIGSPFVAKPQAPVLVVPYVFEPGLCKALIAHYEMQGGQDSGFMREMDGKTVGVIDYMHKRRRDCEIADDRLRTTCMHRIYNNLVPQIAKAYQYTASRMERYIVACYDAEEKGHFRTHRDNTTKGTAHRRFAVSLFLNSGEYEGGYLRFPEFGPALYSAPLGGAVVFSCSLLHEATPVTAGQRYMFLPFLYDDAAAAIRQENAQHIDSRTINENPQ